MQKARHAIKKSFEAGIDFRILPVVLLTALLIGAPGVSKTNAQKKKSRAVFETNAPQTEPPAKIAFVVEVGKNAGVAVRIENADGTSFEGAESFSLLSEFFTLIGERDATKSLIPESDTEYPYDLNAPPPTKKKPIKTATQKISFAEVIIKPQPGAAFGSIVKLADAARNSTMRVKIKFAEDGADPYLHISRKILTDRKYNPMYKPNPNTLIVFLGKDGSLRLNMDEQGSLNDLSRLAQVLTQLFNDREARGVLRENTNLVETTVYLNAPKSASFAEVVKIAKAVREAGGAPLRLQIDNLPE